MQSYFKKLTTVAVAVQATDLKYIIEEDMLE